MWRLFLRKINKNGFYIILLKTYKEVEKNLHTSQNVKKQRKFKGFEL